MQAVYSLIPRPCHRPVFDYLAVCKNGRGTLCLFYHMNDVRTSLRPYLVPFLPQVLEF